jgi:ubiquitin-protein ligase
MYAAAAEPPSSAPSVIAFSAFLTSSPSALVLEQWAAGLTLSAVLKAWMSLMVTPGDEDAQQPARLKQYRENRALYLQTAREWTRKYAM